MAVGLSSDRQREPSDPLIRFLLGLIVADEQRHHELTQPNDRNSRMSWRGRAPKGWPGARKRAKRKRLLASVERFLEAERKGIKEYERLKKKARGSIATCLHCSTRR